MTSDIQQLQGTWSVVALEIEGHNMPSAVFTGAKIVITGSSFTSIAMGAVYDGTIEADPTTTPKSFNLIFATGPEKGNTSFGIYELDEDTWKICLTITGDSRPTRFATEPGSGHALETFKRETITDQSAPEAGHEAASELEGEWSMVSCIRDGEPLDEPLVSCAKRVIKGNQTTMFFGPQVYMKTSFTIDRAKEPKSIDFVHTLGPNVGKTQQGIYGLDGETLRFSFSTPGEDRPTDFTAKRGDGRTVTVWTLIRKQ